MCTVCKNLVSLWLLVSAGAPGTNPLWILRGHCREHENVGLRQRLGRTNVLLSCGTLGSAFSLRPSSLHLSLCWKHFASADFTLGRFCESLSCRTFPVAFLFSTWIGSDKDSFRGGIMIHSVSLKLLLERERKERKKEGEKGRDRERDGGGAKNGGREGGREMLYTHRKCTYHTCIGTFS